MGERLSSLSGSGQSPAAKWFLVHFELKRAILVIAILLSRGRPHYLTKSARGGGQFLDRQIYFATPSCFSPYADNNGRHRNAFVVFAARHYRPHTRASITIISSHSSEFRVTIGTWHCIIVVRCLFSSCAAVWRLYLWSLPVSQRLSMILMAIL